VNCLLMMEQTHGFHSKLIHDGPATPGLQWRLRIQLTVSGHSTAERACYYAL